jgi:large subunit ribosomal protein L25
VGVKASGGILDQVLREVEIECLPGDIPTHVDLDVSHLEMYGVSRVSDLPHPQGVKYLNAEDATVAHVVSIRAEAPTAAETEAAALAAATAAEPEVAKKGKPEAEAGAKKPDAGSGAKK